MTTKMPSVEEIFNRILYSIIMFVVGSIAISVGYFIIGLVLVVILVYCVYYALFGEY